MGDICLVVKLIRKSDSRHVRQLGRDDFARWTLAGEQLPADFAELQIGFARNDVVRQGDNALSFFTETAD